MRSTIRGRFLLAAACLIAGQPLWGQQDAPESPCHPRLEVAVLYDALLSNVVRADRFWMQGGGIQIEGQFLARSWSGGGHLRISRTECQQRRSGAGHGEPLPSDRAICGRRHTTAVPSSAMPWWERPMVLTASFPALARPPAARTVWRCRLGAAWIWRSNIVFCYRAFEADWLRTELPNADTNVQNNIRLAAGVVCPNSMNGWKNVRTQGLIGSAGGRPMRYVTLSGLAPWSPCSSLSLTLFISSKFDKIWLFFDFKRRRVKGPFFYGKRAAWVTEWCQKSMEAAVFREGTRFIGCGMTGSARAGLVVSESRSNFRPGGASVQAWGPDWQQAPGRGPGARRVGLLRGDNGIAWLFPCGLVLLFVEPRSGVDVCVDGRGRGCGADGERRRSGISPSMATIMERALIWPAMLPLVASWLRAASSQSRARIWSRPKFSLRSPSASWSTSLSLTAARCSIM